jgi:phage terminase small subunit
MPRCTKELTEKQAAFVDEYLVDLNASAAAVRAGFSVKSADKISSELMGKTRVAAAIRKSLDKRSARVEVTQDQVIRELAILAFSSIENYELRDELLRLVDGAPSTAMRAISSVTVEHIPQQDGEDRIKVKYTLWSKPEALKLLAQHLGMLIDKHQLEAGPSLLDLLISNVKEQAK